MCLVGGFKHRDDQYLLDWRIVAIITRMVLYKAMSGLIVIKNFKHWLVFLVLSSEVIIYLFCGTWFLIIF